MYSFTSIRGKQLYVTIKLYNESISFKRTYIVKHLVRMNHENLTII